MDGDGPGQPQGILRESAELLFLYFLFLLIISIAHVFPHHAPHVVFLSALRLHPDEFLSEVHHLSQRSIHPPAVGIIIEQHHLCAALELQFLQGGQAGLGKLTLDLALEAYDVVVDAAQVLVVDKVHLVAPCGQCDAEAVFLRYGSLAEVEQLQVGGRDGVGTDAVEHRDESLVALAVDLAELYAEQGHLLEHPGREKEGVGIEAV